jgi:hypothetical protein
MAIRGRGVDAARFAVTPQQALSTLASVHPRELELVQFMDAPFYRAQDTLEDVVLVTADAGPAIRNGFTEAELRTAAAAAMPDARMREAVWLTAYDSYYYDRAAERPLPVLRVKYDDVDGTWLYLAARDGAVVQRETSSGRPVRWLYRGLHSLDFPGLYGAGWLWDAVIVTLCTGGLLLSLTSVAVGWRFLRRFRT